MVKLPVKIADLAINGHNNMFAWNMCHLVLISHKNRAHENTLGWASQLCHVNAEWTSFRNKFHSEMKVILESCK